MLDVRRHTRLRLEDVGRLCQIHACAVVNLVYKAPAVGELPSVGSLAEPADRRPERRLDRLVALVRGLVLPVALDLGLDVRHWWEPRLV